METHKMAVEAAEWILETSAGIKSELGGTAAKEFLEALRDLLIRIFPADVYNREHYFLGTQGNTLVARAHWTTIDNLTDEWESIECQDGYELAVLEGAVVKHTESAVGFWCSQGTLWIPKSVMQDWDQCPDCEGSWVSVWPIKSWWIKDRKLEVRE